MTIQFFCLNSHDNHINHHHHYYLLNFNTHQMRLFSLPKVLIFLNVIIANNNCDHDEDY